MNEDIKTWLNSADQNFTDGLDLLRGVCKNKFLVRSLSLKNNSYNRAKLISELNKQLNGHGRTDNACVVSTKPPPAPSQLPSHPPTLPPDIDLNNMTEEQTLIAVEKLEVALGKMHNKKGMLSNSLSSFSAGDNEGRKKVLDQIEGLNDDMREIKTKLNYYHKHGKLPPVKKEKNIFDDIPGEAVAMSKMILNERTNISKYKKTLKEEITEEHRLKVETRLSNSTKIIAEIERRLNG